jgi:ADP-ribose pyrophosphatase YjhB (NUDIX family)
MNFHYLQLLILKSLATHPNSTFKQLNVHEYDANLFSYHLKVLIDNKFITRSTNNTYRLTLEGKKVVVRLETHSFTSSIPEQGQNAVMCVIFLGKDLDSKVIIQTRLKEPYYGYKGFPTEKILFGETIIEAAKRCMKLETNFASNSIEYKGYVHWINSMDDEIVEDKYMHIICAFDSSGELKEKTEFLENEISTLIEYKENNRQNIYPNNDEVFEIITSATFKPLEVRKSLDKF